METKTLAEKTEDNDFDLEHCDNFSFLIPYCGLPSRVAEKYWVGFDDHSGFSCLRLKNSDWSGVDRTLTLFFTKNEKGKYDFGGGVEEVKGFEDDIQYVLPTDKFQNGEIIRQFHSKSDLERNIASHYGLPFKEAKKFLFDSLRHSQNQTQIGYKERLENML